MKFRPKRQLSEEVEARLPPVEEPTVALKKRDLISCPIRWGKYRVRLTKADLAKQEAMMRTY